MSRIVLRCHYRTAVALGMEPLEPHLHGTFLPVIDNNGEAWAWALPLPLTKEEMKFCLILRQSRRAMRRLSGGPSGSAGA
jgi:hypothetical protein